MLITLILKRGLITLNNLIEEIETLKQSSTAKVIKKRLESFKANGYKSEDDVFSELCYCILTANCSAESCLNIERNLYGSYHRYNQESLTDLLRLHRYRFPNTRAAYIANATMYKSKIKTRLAALQRHPRRNWLVEQIKGIGYKEASHFLRNIGYFNYAIIDRHILFILATSGIISPPKTITKKTYLQIEQTMEEIADHTNLSLAGLDLYLWYMRTGKILK